MMQPHQVLCDERTVANDFTEAPSRARACFPLPMEKGKQAPKEHPTLLPATVPPPKTQCKMSLKAELKKKSQEW